MHLRKIPRSGEELSVIGLGTWKTFDIASERGRRPLIEVVERFSAAGGRVIDTSAMYGRAEEVVGELKAHARQPFLATKVWTRGREAGIEQMKRSMRRLRATQIDLMQIHNLVDWRTHLVTLRQWKGEGHIRYLGVTHYQPGAFPQLAEIMQSEKIDFVQLPLSVAVTQAEEKLLPLAQSKGIAVLVNRPFESGSLLRDVRRKPLPPWAAEFDCRSWSEIFLRYVVSHPAVTCVIPATSNPQHLGENMRAGEGRILSMQERSRLRTLVRQR
ncbi:MAG TPA: aldo/keto reductase [Thermoanaerobaculia bacterium]